MSMSRAFVAKGLTGLCAIYRAAVPSTGLRVLMYHAIGSRIPSDTQKRYTLSLEQFSEHMRHLKSLSAPIVALRDPDDFPCIALSFDDGYRDNFTRMIYLFYCLQD